MEGVRINGVGGEGGWKGLINLIAKWGRGNFIWYVKIEYKSTIEYKEVFKEVIASGWYHFLNATNFWIKCILLEILILSRNNMKQ